MNDLPETSNNGTDLSVVDYLRGVKSSTCLLLPTTPSPTPLDFKHPLSAPPNDEAYMELSDENNMTNLDVSAGDSSSSGDSTSVVQDPVSAQLINNISMIDYQTLSKTGNLIIGQDEDTKLNGNVTVNTKLPNFVNWNWNIIRKVLLWIVLSALIACLAAIVTMIITIPKSCNPELPWFQGKIFYEVFPASFKDSNNDSIGDLKGLIKKIDYIESLGASAIRLNYIFEAQQYSEYYFNSTYLLTIDTNIGTLKDFQDLVIEIHSRNLSIILDLPVLSMVKLTPSTTFNSSQTLIISNQTVHNYDDPTTTAIAYWARVQNVDGFYLKKLEKHITDLNFRQSIQLWKQIIGNNKILMVNENVYENVDSDSLHVLLSNIDLIDVHINLHNGIDGLKNHIEKIVSGSMWTKPYYSWVHWNIGNVNSERISTKYLNNTLALTVLEFMLPGTINIFYGDEIGLGGLPFHTVDPDFREHEHVHNLVPMIWGENEKNTAILSWNSNSVLEPRYNYLDVVKHLTQIRLNTPTIYLNAIYKESNILRNMEIRNSEHDLVVIERWHPRRNTCVFVGNLGNTYISTDMSSMFYGGMVIASTNVSLVGQILYFDEITFPPNSAIILKLEK